MQTHFTFHSDPGHGWLEVSIEDLALAGLKIHDFSECSYRRGHRLFLEEDCDAPLFIRAMRAAGHSVTAVEENINDDHWIRDCNRIW